jgi:high-affinity iron transporter
MLATLIIVFREMIEAGLVIGIVLAATKGVPHRTRWVCYGVLAGVAGACVVALFAGKIAGMMQGSGQEIFNASVLAAAVLMLTWHNVWMARTGRHIASEMKNFGQDVSLGKRSLNALAIVVGLAVLREGAEVVLFLYGIALSGGSSTASMLTGGALGVASGAVISVLMYTGLMRIPTRYLFTVTSWLIALLAAGMASQAIVYLQQAGIVNIMSEIVWDSSAILSEGSLFGTAMHTLIGYTDQPSAIQLVVYVATLAAIFTLMKLFAHAPKPTKE